MVSLLVKVNMPQALKASKKQINISLNFALENKQKPNQYSY